MTEKRFSLICDNNVEWLMQTKLFLPIRDKNINQKITLKQCIDLLNELNDKCDFREIKNDSVEDGLTKYAELYHQSLKENEQLQLQNRELQLELDIRKEDINHSNKVFMKLCDKNNELKEENLQLKDILKDIMIELNANHTMNTYQVTIPINKVIYNELNRRLEETPFNEELRRFLE